MEVREPAAVKQAFASPLKSLRLFQGKKVLGAGRVAGGW